MGIHAADYIDSLEKQLKVAHKISNEQLRILFDTLLHYKQNLPGLFHSLQSQAGHKILDQKIPTFYARLAVLPGYPVYPVSVSPDSVFSQWKDRTFDDDEMLTRIALTKLKHDLILSSYQLIQFVRNEIAESVEDFTTFDVV